MSAEKGIPLGLLGAGIAAGVVGFGFPAIVGGYAWIVKALSVLFVLASGASYVYLGGGMPTVRT